ncbi:MAG: GMC family oxidoreductase [Alphaproteobacteria bacterium]|nr:GMC family oxidoreductase [Alphaproteobacteria bacterium]
MIEDFRGFEDGRTYEADICIIGGGPAGITIARELIGSRASVLLLESGGREYEDEVQALYAGRNVGLPYFDLDVTRLRYFGGSTNHWGNYCGPLREIDFEERSWVPFSGWPITLKDLDPYYRRAQQICALGRYSYGRERWVELGLDVPAFDPAKVLPNVRQIGPQLNFAEAYGPELAAAENIRVLLHANVVNIQSNPTATSVAHLDIRTLEGKRGQVTARQFILACGGIENPRLLLASNGVEQNGLGNRQDLVGRFFLEHPKAWRMALLRAKSPLALVQAYTDRFHDGVHNRPRWRLARTAQEDMKCLNGEWGVGTDADRQGGTIAARKMWQNLKRGRWPDDLGEKVWRIASDLDDVGVNAYREFMLGEEPIPEFQNVIMWSTSEQAPNPDSRVMLGEQRDALGIPRVQLDWRLTELDKYTKASIAKIAAAELARLGIARAKLEDWLLDPNGSWPDVAGEHHHMGTTRMSDDPKKGVVQGDCRVHGVDNLYIAGSSVFPTGGTVNPTLTIVALALRLADHLKPGYAS